MSGPRTTCDRAITETCPWYRSSNTVVARALFDLSKKAILQCRLKVRTYACRFRKGFLHWTSLRL